MNTNMKTFFLSLSILFGVMGISFKQQPTYDFEKSWKEVKGFMDKGLPKSALEKVEEIHVEAVSQDLKPQILKSSIYISRLLINTEEEGLVMAIDRLQTIIEKNDGIVNKVLLSYLAELYESYFNNNRWELAQRTDLVSPTSQDFRTWTTSQFITTIEQYYLASLEDVKVLDVPVSEFKDIIEEFDAEGAEIKPTLYEILADKAIKFFDNASNNYPDNAQNSSFDDINYFGSASSFISWSLDVKVSDSPKLKILVLYQKLLKKQIAEKAQTAEAFYDLSRLQFVHNISTNIDKDSLYENALLSLASHNISNPYHTEIIGTWAQYKLSQNNASEGLTNIINACELAIAKFPQSKGAAVCKNIITQIKSPQLTAYIEKVYSPTQHIIWALDYKNISDLSCYFVKLDDRYDALSRDYNNNSLENYLKGLTPINKSNPTLEPSEDFKLQRAEFLGKPLKYGRYALVLESKDKSMMSYEVFHVSDLAWRTFTMDGKRYFNVMDRISGQPLAGVKLTTQYNSYNRGTRNNEWINGETYLSDKQGRVVVSVQAYSHFNAIFSKGQDVLKLDANYWASASQPKDKRQLAEIYTDRSIYRPGQIVYFKAILLENDENNIPHLLTHQNCDVTLRDANYQEISKLTLKSNKYGSVTGSFVLPSNKMTGNFTIQIGNNKNLSGYKNFNVEEYKRPTYQLSALPIEGSYKLGQTLQVKAKAETLAGSAVDGADVSYKVVRTARFPSWGYWWRRPTPTSEFIIKQGQTTTNENGELTIDFEAIPDKSIKPEEKPMFNYRVDIDVTDQRGETRSTQAYVTVGYQMLTLELDVSNGYDISQKKPWSVQSKNLQGGNVDAKGTIKVFKLEEPKNVLIKRYWSGEIQYPIPYDQFNKILPYFPHNDNFTLDQWKVEKEVVSSNWTSGDNLDFGLQAGVYKIVVQCMDEAGQDVVMEKYTVVSDIFNRKLPKDKFLHTLINGKTFEPGENFTMKLASSDGPIHAHILIENGQKKIFDKTFKVSKASNLSIPIEEYMRGGFSVVVSYVIQNRVFVETYHISVPWSNKQLSVKFESFRDKTLPGGEEEYKIIIEGPNKDKVMAEMLMSMYDASLDQFVGHHWQNVFYPNYFGNVQLSHEGFYHGTSNYVLFPNSEYAQVLPIRFPELIPLNDFSMYGVQMRGSRHPEMMMAKSMSVDEEAPVALTKAGSIVVMDDTANTEQNETTPKPSAKTEATPRKNLNETVFFFPQLTTDSEGRVVVKFKMNEALTQWKLMSLVHTEDFKVGYDERTVQTQKDIMIFPNAPRFVRDGDKIYFSGKVTNLTQDLQDANVKLQLWDALNMKDVTQELIKSDISYNVKIEKGRSAGVFWELVIPERYVDVLTYRMSAETAHHSDAEENTLPILTDRMLVTETMPMWIKGNESKMFHFNAFKNNNSLTKKDFNFAFEYTANPIWYAIQALPYMNDVPNITSMALAERLYANILASKIANAHPKIKAVFDQWLIKDKEAMLSNLSKNEELKQAIMEETPWVRQALSEEEQKRNIALLFDMVKMSAEREDILQKLAQLQLSNGGFPWLASGRDNVYITQNIMENIGHLYQLGALEIGDPQVLEIVSNALRYMDEELVRRYEKLKTNIKSYGGKLEDDHLDELSIMYLYVRSFFKHVQPSKNSGEARKYYISQCEKYWLNRSLSGQAMIGFVLNRQGSKVADDIYKSLGEKASHKEEMGMYWNEGNGYYWYELPIERHALLLEFFVEMGAKQEVIDAMKIWLLKNKQTTHWKTSKATSSAIYALLIQGEGEGISTWVVESVQPVITVGNELLNTSIRDSESGTGYIKKSWRGSDFPKEMGTIKVTNNNSSVAWGAAYYQYFEKLENIKAFEDTPLKINKTTYIVQSSLQGDKLVNISENTDLSPGDKLMVRIEIRVDRNMEYVMMKDMRASGTEPINVLSQYKYSGRLGYYEATKDVATHFYFDQLPKGTYVFEYPLRVVHKGDFSIGITTIGSMYAPEFSSHSAGNRLKIK